MRNRVILQKRGRNQVIEKKRIGKKRRFLGTVVQMMKR